MVVSEDSYSVSGFQHRKSAGPAGAETLTAFARIMPARIGPVILPIEFVGNATTGVRPTVSDRWRLNLRNYRLEMRIHIARRMQYTDHIDAVVQRLIER